MKVTQVQIPNWELFFIVEDAPDAKAAMAADGIPQPGEKLFGLIVREIAVERKYGNDWLVTIQVVPPVQFPWPTESPHQSNPQL